MIYSFDTTHITYEFVENFRGTYKSLLPLTIRKLNLINGKDYMQISKIILFTF